MGIKLFAIFISAVFIDGIMLPALFGFSNSMLSWLVLITPVLFLGLEKQYITYGLFFSVILESFRGLEFGSLSLPFLFLVVVIYLAQRFLDIKFTYETRFGFGKSVLLALVSAGLIYIFSVFYRYGDLGISFMSLVIALIILLEALILSLVLNATLNKRDYFLN